MTKYNLYSGNSTGNTRYIGNMTIDKGKVVDLEILPPNLYGAIADYVQRSKEGPLKRDVKTPYDVFMGRLSDISYVDAKDDPKENGR